MSTLVHGIEPGQSYSESIREFCLSIHYHGPAAYRALRKRFKKNHLPHPHTIASWYRYCSVRSEPGIHASTLERLKAVALEVKKNSGQPLICSLIADEMDIRKQILWSNQLKKYVGYISYGIKPEEQNRLPVANQALVFMLSGINQNFVFPVCYHLIRSLKTADKITLLNEVISRITECGVVIKNLTFDGLRTNFSMSNELGANLDIHSKDFQPFFRNPIDKSKIFIMLDNCHAEKLVRNTLGNKDVIWDDENKPIEWNYFVELEKFSRSNDFCTHKLNSQHINFKKKNMNVKIATETMSNSVADSMQFLLDKGVKEFENAKPTIRFIKFVITLFGIFNSKSCRSKQIFKNGLTVDNKDAVFTFFNQAEAYIKMLRIKVINKNGNFKRVFLTKSLNKTAFVGYLINFFVKRNIFRIN